MPSSRGHARSSPRSGSSSRQPVHPPSNGRPQTPGGGGPGIVPLLALIVLLAGVVAVLARSGVLSTGPSTAAMDGVPACQPAVNRWADQRLSQARSQLEQEHGFSRTQANDLNPVTEALNWIEDRIIAQRLADEREQIRSSVLSSSRCLVQFQP